MPGAYCAWLRREFLASTAGEQLERSSSPVVPLPVHACSANNPAIVIPADADGWDPYKLHALINEATAAAAASTLASAHPPGSAASSSGALADAATSLPTVEVDRKALEEEVRTRGCQKNAGYRSVFGSCGWVGVGVWRGPPDYS